MVALLAACGGSENAASRFDVRAEYARVSAARARLEAAHARLDRALGVPPGPDGSAGGSAGDVAAARAAYDEAYAANQRALARFLSIALNVAPARPETRQALDAFARDAVANARDVLDRGAERGAVTTALLRAERAYRALGLAVPPGLSASLEELRRTPSVQPTPSPSPTAAGPARPSRRRPRRR